MIEEETVVDPIPQVVQSPVFAVQEDHDRAGGLAIQPHLAGQRANEGIAQRGLRPVITAVSQQEGVEGRNLLVREDWVVEDIVTVRYPRINAQALAGMPPTHVAVDAQADFTLESQRSVRFKKLKMSRPLPLPTPLPIIVGPIISRLIARHINPVRIAEQPIVCHGYRYDTEGIAVGARGIDHVRLRGNGSRQQLLLEQPRSQHIQFGDLSGLHPVFLEGIAPCTRADIGLNIRLAGSVSELDRIRIYRRRLARLGTVQGVTDGRAFHVRRDLHGDVVRIKTARHRE